ncbi:hypothetical protein BZB76_2787 [Actinomadura pelletieri DSM 43383]|uniref:Uncharacterized protein n=1 Tax=Actinomadura pelletieri DSM 43383 TaxID=1120940 RepID=A0A495QMU4_9ACTN|nr:hypothetical protein [Actinomadura pelletieri]RKS74277.1 hypothetical protein BZB76_2787 [Actinomadura pelletieri DSM 43383]
MGVSLYYTARRERDLNERERDRVAEIVEEENRELLDRLNQRLPGWKDDGTVPASVTDAKEVCEGFGFYGDASNDQGVILDGSSKISHGQCGAPFMFEQLEHYMRSTLGRLRSALPDADWDAHVDGHALIWDEENSRYTFAPE